MDTAFPNLFNFETRSDLAQADLEPATLLPRLLSCLDEFVAPRRCAPPLSAGLRVSGKQWSGQRSREPAQRGGGEALARLWVVAPAPVCLPPSGVSGVDYCWYPTQETQLLWLRFYLQAQKGTAVTPREVERLYVQVNKFALVSA